jgi:hypothetical protein
MKLALTMMVTGLFLSAPAFAAEMGGEKSGGKGKYLVTATHTPEECLAAMDDVAKDKKLLEKAEWGCMGGDGMSGEHAVYLRTDANSPEDAINQLPASQRKNAKAVKLTKLTAAQIKQLHQHDMGAKKK